MEWEYFVLKQLRGNSIEYADGNNLHLPVFQGMTIQEILNMLGKDSWELISVADTSLDSDSRPYAWYFKRPINR